jgi:hypothetical protein
MSYRDDRDADRARIEALEAELSTAKDRIAELEGRRSQALVLASQNALAPAGKPTAASRWLGAPLVLELSRTFDHAIAIERFDDLVARCREVAREPGSTEMLRTSFTWTVSGNRIANTTVMVSVRDQTTTLTVGDRLHQLAGALYGGVGGGLGGGGITAPVFASMAVPVLAPVFFVAWFGGVYGVTRALFRRAAKRRARLVGTLFDALVVEIERAGYDQPPPSPPTTS